MKYCFAFLIVIYSCTKNTEYEYPLVITGKVTNITKDSLLLSAKITDLGKYPIPSYGFYLSTNPYAINPVAKYEIQGSPKIGVYSLHVSAPFLKDGTLYYILAFINSNNSISYGVPVSFKLPVNKALKISDQLSEKWKKTLH